jgi:hypothetical protein
VLLSELRAFIKRFGHTAQRRCQSLGGLLDTTGCALSKALALGRPALVCGLLSARSRLVASSALLEPTHMLPLSLRLLLGRVFLALISQAVALICHVFTVVGGSLSLIREPFALIRDAVTLIRRPLALVRPQVALVGHPLRHRQFPLLTTAPTLIAQPVTLALQHGIIGRQARRPAPDVRGEALNLEPGRFIGGPEEACA